MKVFLCSWRLVQVYYNMQCSSEYAINMLWICNELKKVLAEAEKNGLSELCKIGDVIWEWDMVFEGKWDGNFKKDVIIIIIISNIYPGWPFSTKYCYQWGPANWIRLGVNFEEGGNQSACRKTSKSGWDRLKLKPHTTL